jgi:hypothetical protein
MQSLENVLRATGNNSKDYREEALISVAEVSIGRVQNE